MVGDHAALNTTNAIIEIDLSLGRPTGWADGFPEPAPLSDQLHSSRSTNGSGGQADSTNLHIHFGPDTRSPHVGHKTPERIHNFYDRQTLLKSPFVHVLRFIPQPHNSYDLFVNEPALAQLNNL
jgi:hypothetical protein